MARPREFDAKETLEKAMQLFWRKGYSGTSMRDLVDYTGVAHAGLYAAFGDKETLFAAAVDQYRRQVGDWLLGDLERPSSGRAEIEELFERVRSGVETGGFERGCFMVATGVELGTRLDGPQISFARMQSGFENALVHAVKKGEVRKTLDPESTAIALMTSFNGISVLIRSGCPNEVVYKAIDGALILLD